MRDLTHTFTAARMHAEGTITYGTPVAGVRATGTVTIVQYANLAAPRNRLKVVLGGTSPTITGKVRFIARND